MDPLTALSLAGNLAQLVELSAKILAEARAVYISGARTTDRVEALRQQTESLQALAARAPPLGAGGTGTPDELALVELLDKAKKLAHEMKGLLIQLEAKHQKSKFDAMRIVVKANIKKSDLERLERKVAGCRADIIERWITMTSDKQSSTLDSLKKDLGRLSEANDKVVHAIDDTNRALDDAVKSIRQQMQLDSATLEAIREGAERISRIMTETRTLNDIIKKLKFEEIHIRELSIADANQHTFRWLLYDQSREQSSGSGVNEAKLDTERSTYITLSPGLIALIPYKSQLCVQEEKRAQTRKSFLRWLRFEHGLFYISGKPGSGKSTLMKLLGSEEKTAQELEAWTAGKALIFARFFFWDAGTKNQRSLDGLYRAILWEALYACPDVAREVFPEYLRCPGSKTAGRLGNDIFTTAELRTAFIHLITSKEVFRRHKICIFIDGLDEYDGDHWDIAKNLIAWSKNPEVKICVSCRPHNDFEHHFRRGNIRALRLHELTWSDMLGLVNDRLFSDERFNAVRDQDNFANFGEELVRRAEGIFLWLTLAIKDLLDGLGSAYSLSQLRGKLDTVPNDVENIYKKLLDSISLSDRRLASRTLLAMLELRKPVWRYEARSDIVFSLLDDLEDQGLGEPQLLSGTLDLVLTDEKMARRREIIQMRINKRCKGLLQAGPGGWFHKSKIFEPIHRTMLDYLTQPENLARLKEGAVDFDPHLSLLLCHLRLIQVVELGAEYHPLERNRQGVAKVERSLVDSYRLSRSLLSISNQIMAAMTLITDHQLFIRLVSIIGDVFERHFLSFRQLRNSNWLVSTSPGVWRRRQFSGLFSGHDDHYTTSFTCYLIDNLLSYDKLDLILSQARWGSPVATRKLLLCISSKVSQTMTWNEAMAKDAIVLLDLLLQHKLDPNAVLPEETICVRSLSGCHTKYGDYWTSWTASLFSAVSHVDNREPNAYLVEIVATYISYDADARVALVGYLMEDSSFKGLSDSKPLPAGPRYSGPFYIDILQLLYVWRAAGLGGLAPLIAEVQRRSAAPWATEMKNLLKFWKEGAKDKIKKLDINELKSKPLVVLAVTPVQRVSDIMVEGLEHLLRSLKSGEEVEFVNMI